MWIKRPEYAAGVTYINICRLVSVSCKENVPRKAYHLVFHTEIEQIEWKFRSSESLQTYIKENLERYMEITV